MAIIGIEYNVEPASPPAEPPPPPPPPPRRRSWLRGLVAVAGLALLVAFSAGLGAAGGYVLARRELSAAILPPPPITQAVSVRYESTIIDTVRRVKPAVVTVVTSLQPQAVAPQGYAPFGYGPMLRQQDLRGSGSGVIIDAQGHIVTNYHVIEKAARIEIVFHDGTKASAPAMVVGADPYSDLAIIKVNGPIPAFAELGDSNALQEGETVIAIGSPLGEFRGSITVGVVSALNRTLDVNPTMSLEGLIQTDAAINQGNSGGPLVNLAGQVVGINAAIVRSDPNSGRFSAALEGQAEGLGFAIPSATVRDTANQIIALGRVEHPYLGVRYQEISPGIAAAYNLPVRYGLFVQDVERNSPAAQVGIQRGDILADIDSTPLNADNSLVKILMRKKVGDEVTLTVYRAGQKLSLKTKLAGR